MSLKDGILRRMNALLGRREEEKAPEYPRAQLSAPAGALDPGRGEATCVFVVGPSFNQDLPTAMTTFRQGYAAAFESLGIPYLFLDQHDLCEILPGLPNPFCLLNGSDYRYMEQRTLGTLRRYPHCVWVDPWFAGSERFFTAHGLDPAIWYWSAEHRKRILDSGPAFVHTATVPGGLGFFAEWERHGMKVASLPLACDLSLYAQEQLPRPEFQGVKLAFVGGYWESKGKQLDKYLRAFEEDLVIYGYSPWPYRGYRGMLDRASEPHLYRQALLSPVINEPSVEILKGQINERIFKVLGAGGVPLVDAVPAYRELFSADELVVPADAGEFHDLVRRHLAGDGTLLRYARKGREAVLARHTYQHRARQLLALLGFEELLEGSKEKPHGIA